MSAEAQAVIEKIKAKIAAADPNPANRKVLVVFDVKITSGGKVVKQYTADLKKLELYEGPYAGTVDVTITVDDAAMVAIAKKELSQAEAKSQGKLTIEGDAEAISKIDLLDLKLGLKA